MNEWTFEPNLDFVRLLNRAREVEPEFSVDGKIVRYNPKKRHEIDMLERQLKDSQ